MPQRFDDRTFFPAFEDCPAEHDWDERFLKEVGGHLENRLHWCLLGQIIDANTFLRPRIVARDHTGQDFVVAFYPDRQEDMPRLLSQFKVGNTIAIFYALVHEFLDGTTGCRIEDADEVLILPMSFDSVLKMNKDVVAYAQADGAKRKCHGCDELKEGMNKCGRCQMFYYCSKECQTKGWTDKSHKTFCKVLKDPNVQTMHNLDYAKYEACISFH